MKNLIFPIVALLLTVQACKKGDKGEPGPTGVNGTNGINGTNGMEIQSMVVNNKDLRWLGPTTEGDMGAYINTDLITQKVVDSGKVEVYIGDLKLWMPLPGEVNNNHYSYVFEKGRVCVFTGTSGILHAAYFKVIVTTPIN